VIARFARCNHVVVTTDTGANDLRVVNRSGGNGYPRRRKFFMARVTYIATGNMTCIFTTGKHTVMTGNTVIYKLAVINSSRCPSLRAMTIATFLSGGNMV